MRSERWLRRQRRRLFGRYAVDDPRPIAVEAPYTFHLPSENELLAIRPTDLVKVIIRSVPRSFEWEAERMWITVVDIDGDRLTGNLENAPFDMPQLHVGSSIVVRRSDVIDIEWNPDRPVAPPSGPTRRWYWERCLVDDCVLRGDSPVDYVYREDADMAQEGDAYPDSGWRIRGTDEGIAADAECGQAIQYVAVGAVLNKDDSWLDLIDAPTGSAFVRDPESGGFRACDPDVD